MVFRVVIDAVFFQINQTGIARVWRSLLERWSKSKFSGSLIVIDRGSTAPKIEGLSYVSMPLYDYRDAALDSERLQAICDRLHADLFISTYYTTPLRTPSITMIYDMVPEVIGLDPNEVCWREKRYAILSGDRHLTISQNTAKDLRRFYPHIQSSHIDVVYLGVDQNFFPYPKTVQQKIQTELGITLPYFVLVGDRMSLKGYKNAILFFKALQKWHQSSSFAVVCVGGKSDLEPELAVLVPGMNIHLVKLDDRQLAAIYSGAIALIYPSLYEGFGLPIIEAMACGCPVITCRNSSIPEVAGEAAIYVDERDESEMINSLEQVLQPEVRLGLMEAGYVQAKGFSWQKTAQQIETIFRQFVAEQETYQAPTTAKSLLWQELRAKQQKLEEIRHLLGSYQPSPTDAIQSLQVDLSNAHQGLMTANEEIAAIKSSKFWAIRSQWLRLKKRLKGQ